MESFKTAPNGDIKIKVATEFSATPGARFIDEGPFSAEEFRKNIVEPAYSEARMRGVNLIIDLDDVAGYATSFLQGTFGNLAAQNGSEEVASTVVIISEDDPYLKDYIKEYIRDADEVLSPVMA